MEELKQVKEELITIIAHRLGDLYNVNVCELGEMIDIIKDISETMYYCAHAEKIMHELGKA